MADILLIEPGYRNKYPPIGLMKISYFHKYVHHDQVRFAKGVLPASLQGKKWDRVYVSTLFTFEWEKTKQALEYARTVVKPDGSVYTGGVLATLMPEQIRQAFPEVILNEGLLNRPGTLGLEHEEDVDKLPLDYGILDDIKTEYVYPEADSYFACMTRGCGMKCSFCAVQTLEPSYVPYLSITGSVRRTEKEFGPKKNLLLMDNNVLRSPEFDKIIDEVKALGFGHGATYLNPKTGKRILRYVDFNQGLDAALLTEHKARRLSELALRPARIAFDHMEDQQTYVKAITLCAENGITHMSNYLLYNGDNFSGKGNLYRADTPVDLYLRMKLSMELGEELTIRLGRQVAIFSFPMRYIPLSELERGYIGTSWNAKELRALQCMLIPTQGKGVSSRSFFEADFGVSPEEFQEFLMMPEALLSRRGHFVERPGENLAERMERLTRWEEDQLTISEWKRLYRAAGWERVHNLVGDNHFTVETMNRIDEPEVKKFYLHYFKGRALISAVTEGSAKTSEVLRPYVTQEFPLFYVQIVEHASTRHRLTLSMTKGLLDLFGKSFVQAVMSRIEVLYRDNHLLYDFFARSADSGKIGFDFLLLEYAVDFQKAGVFSTMDEESVEKAARSLDSDKIRDVMVRRLPEFCQVMAEAGQSASLRLLRTVEKYLNDPQEEQYEQLSLL